MTTDEGAEDPRELEPASAGELDAAYRRGWEAADLSRPMVTIGETLEAPHVEAVLTIEHRDASRTEHVVGWPMGVRLPVAGDGIQWGAAKLLVSGVTFVLDLNPREGDVAEVAVSILARVLSGELP